MVKLTGNIWDLVKGAADKDKREQLVTPKNPEASTKPGQPNLRLYKEEYSQVRLMLPRSMNKEIDRYFLDLNTKGKNEFLVKAVKEYMDKKGIKWSGK